MEEFPLNWKSRCLNEKCIHISIWYSLKDLNHMFEVLFQEGWILWFVTHVVVVMTLDSESSNLGLNPMEWDLFTLLLLPIRKDLSSRFWWRLLVLIFLCLFRLLVYIFVFVACVAFWTLKNVLGLFLYELIACGDINYEAYIRNDITLCHVMISPIRWISLITLKSIILVLLAGPYLARHANPWIWFYLFWLLGSSLFFWLCFLHWSSIWSYMLYPLLPHGFYGNVLNCSHLMFQSRSLILQSQGKKYRPLFFRKVSWGDANLTIILIKYLVLHVHFSFGVIWIL